LPGRRRGARLLAGLFPQKASLRRARGRGRRPRASPSSLRIRPVTISLPRERARGGYVTAALRRHRAEITDCADRIVWSDGRARRGGWLLSPPVFKVRGNGSLRSARPFSTRSHRLRSAPVGSNGQKFGQTFGQSSAGAGVQFASFTWTPRALARAHTLNWPGGIPSAAAFGSPRPRDARWRGTGRAPCGALPHRSDERS
jgi:hypothetical protein